MSSNRPSGIFIRCYGSTVQGPAFERFCREQYVSRAKLRGSRRDPILKSVKILEQVAEHHPSVISNTGPLDKLKSSLCPFKSLQERSSIAHAIPFALNRAWQRGRLRKGWIFRLSG